MNYLSHYYFDRETEDPREVLGAVLPDMIRSYNKSWTLKTVQNTEQICALSGGSAYLKGWSKHKAIDKVFHSAESFSWETNSLKGSIKEIMKGSPVWTFFLAHIFYELNLDAVLLKQKIVDASKFYESINLANKSELVAFMQASEIKEAEAFLPWLERFSASRFLLKYATDEGVIFALDRICQKLWNSPFNKEQKNGLMNLCENYQKHLISIYPSLFKEVEAGLAEKLD